MGRSDLSESIWMNESKNLKSLCSLETSSRSAPALPEDQVSLSRDRANILTEANVSRDDAFHL